MLSETADLKSLGRVSFESLGLGSEDELNQVLVPLMKEEDSEELVEID